VKDSSAVLEERAAEPELETERQRGRTMTVKARTRAGAQAEYVFSLHGVTAALRHVREECE
jgi:hypothetical protein